MRHPTRPIVVTICGSTRFKVEQCTVALAESLAGRIPLTIAWASPPESKVTYTPWPEEKALLDVLHLRKIDMSQEIFVVNPDGYVGESTRREIAYAWVSRKHIRWLVEPRKEDEGRTSAYACWLEFRNDPEVSAARKAGYDPTIDTRLHFRFGICHELGPHLHDPGWKLSNVPRRVLNDQRMRCATYGCFTLGNHDHLLTVADKSRRYEEIFGGND